MMNEYIRAATRYRAAWDNLNHLKHVKASIDRALDDAEDELAAASQELSKYEDRPGIPKTEYR